MTYYDVFVECRSFLCMWKFGVRPQPIINYQEELVFDIKDHYLVNL